jgi:hypothetical protein
VEVLLSFDPFSNQEEMIPSNELETVAATITQAKNHLFSAIPLDERSILSEKLGALKILIEIAKSRGTLGVRFLQLIGYYIELPEEHQREINQSYDSVRGQMKYTAFRTLKREAEKASASPKLKKFWEDLIELRSTGHGGSLTTVYQALMRDGSLKAVKIMVPNALKFIRETKKEALTVVQELSRMGAYRNKIELKLAAALIEEVANWAEQDVAAKDYEAEERAFQASHDHQGFGQDIELRVPSMDETGTVYIKIEEWVEGRTVVGLSNDGVSAEVLRPVIDTIHADYEQQLSKPVSEGRYLVHPDVHGGQFQVRENGQGNIEVFILDRGFWLDFDQTEATFFNFIRGKETSEEVAKNFFEYLLNLPENQKITKTRKRIIATELFLIVAASSLSADKSQMAMQFFLQLRQNGVIIPLKWTLLQKNEKYLNSLL